MKKITAALVLATSVLASGGAVAAVNFVELRRYSAFEHHHSRFSYDYVEFSSGQRVV